MKPFVIMQDEIGSEYGAVCLLKNQQETLKFPLNAKEKNEVLPATVMDVILQVA